jgi:hypothetical protein
MLPALMPDFLAALIGDCHELATCNICRRRYSLARRSISSLLFRWPPPGWLAWVCPFHRVRFRCSAGAGRPRSAGLRGDCEQLWQSMAQLQPHVVSCDAHSLGSSCSDCRSC